MLNILSFKASGLTFIDSLISKVDKTTPREVILRLTRLEKELKLTKIFILVEKDKNGNYLLYYKNKYNCNSSTMTNYLVVVIIKQYSKPIICIFNAYH